MSLRRRIKWSGSNTSGEEEMYTRSRRGGDGEDDVSMLSWQKTVDYQSVLSCSVPLLLDYHHYHF